MEIGANGTRDNGVIGYVEVIAGYQNQDHFNELMGRFREEGAFRGDKFDPPRYRNALYRCCNNRPVPEWYPDMARDGCWAYVDEERSNKYGISVVGFDQFEVETVMGQIHSFFWDRSDDNVVVVGYYHYNPNADDGRVDYGVMFDGSMYGECCYLDSDCDEHQSCFNENGDLVPKQINLLMMKIVKQYFSSKYRVIEFSSVNYKPGDSNYCKCERLICWPNDVPRNMLFRLFRRIFSRSSIRVDREKRLRMMDDEMVYNCPPMFLYNYDPCDWKYCRDCGLKGTTCDVSDRLSVQVL